MASLNRTLLRPTPAEVESLLRDAVAAANYRCRKLRLAWPLPDLTEFLADYATRPEGQKLWLGATGEETTQASQAAVVWWTDCAGRRHVRVAGNRGPFADRSRLALLSEPSSWPPLAILDSRVFLRTRGGKSELMALCGCGAFGPPESLGWTAARRLPGGVHRGVGPGKSGSGRTELGRRPGALRRLLAGRQLVRHGWVRQHGADVACGDPGEEGGLRSLTLPDER